MRRKALRAKLQSLKCRDDDVYIPFTVTDDDVSLGMIVQLKCDNWNGAREDEIIEWVEVKTRNLNCMFMNDEDSGSFPS